MLNSHGQLAVMPEGGWFGTWYEQGMGIDAHGAVTRDIVPLLLKTHKNIDLGATTPELYEMVEPEGTLPYADFVSRLFNRCGEARGKALVGSKNPDYLRHLPTLRQLWPQAKFVHIFRDGREVCLSASERTKKPGFRGFPFLLYEKPDRIFDGWAEDPVISTALWWERTVRLGRTFGAALPAGGYHEMRYEELVADPEKESRRLCDFLGLPFDDRMLRHEETFVARHGHDGGILHASVGRPVTAGLRDWRGQMAREDLERFEAAAGSLLGELGYERAVPVPSAATVREAERIRRVLDGLIAGTPARGDEAAGARLQAAD
jgi:hypothetical protein